MKKILMLVAILTIGTAAAQTTYECVERVIDGDTIVLEGGERIRLLRIDTPEKKEPGFQEAKDYMINRVEWKVVKIVKKGKGYYRRTLGEIYVNEININDELLELGLAKLYRK